MELELIRSIAIIFGVGSLVNLIFHRFKIPTILGYLLTGILLGPTAFALIEGTHEIEVLAEIGVVLLLFAIGMEFSLAQLNEIRRTVMIGGGLQVLLTIGAAFVLFYLFGIGLKKSVFFGFLIALSSTAVVIKMIQDRSEIATLHGKTSLGILIFQDLIIVPMILLVPFLSGQGDASGLDFLMIMLKTAGIIIAVLLISRYAMPYLLHQIARTQNQELFLLAIMAIGLSVAFLTKSMGLSMALGAFLAGLAISESDYAHQAFGRIQPFRDIFTSFFFVSIGLLVNLNFFFGEFFMVILLTLAVMLGKTIIAGFVSFLLGLPFFTTVVVGLIISQIGEFSFILAKMGVGNGLLTEPEYQMFLAVSVLSMAIAPFIYMAAPSLSNLMIRILPISQRFIQGRKRLPDNEPAVIEKHLLIIGMGVTGHHVAQAARIAGIPYRIIELDPDVVVAERRKGEPMVYGDGSSEAVLNAAGCADAEVIVIGIPNPVATFRAAETVRHMNPRAYIIVRTRFHKDIEALINTGVDEVIPEDYETSVEIFARILNKYLFPRDEIEKWVAEIRAGSYGMFRKPQVSNATGMDAINYHFPDMDIAAIRVQPGSAIVGKSLLESALRRDYSVNVLAVRRKNQNMVNPDPDTLLSEQDIVIVMGENKQVACATKLFTEKGKPDCTKQSGEG